MAYNITSFDEDLFFTVNTAVGTSLFFIIVLTPLVLCVLCVLALIFTRKLNKKLKVLLINIFAAEICTLIRWTLAFLGFPLRFRTLAGVSWICIIDITLSIVGGQQKFTSSALYAVMIYVFIKHGERRLKWYVIVPYIAISWVVVTLVFGLPNVGNFFGIINSNGFCASNPGAILLRATIPLAVLVTMICSGVVVVCCMLTGVYVKRNTLDGNVEVKKAVAKVLAYLSVVTVLSFITGLLPAATSAIREAARASSGTAGEVTVGYILQVIYSIHSIPTPVMAIILLKPVRLAFKKIGKVIILCHCIRKHPDAAENTVVTLEMTI